VDAPLSLATVVGEAQFAPLVDVSQVAIGDLIGSGDTALNRCVQRLISSLDDPNGVISAFGSFVSS
jgi:hypothetical protein